MTLEQSQLEMARSLVMRAQQASPQTALDEFSKSGIEKHDLGLWAFAFDTVCAAVPDVPIDIDSFDMVPPGGWDAHPAKQIVDAAHALHGAKFSTDLQRALSVGIAEIQSGTDPSTVCERIVRAVQATRDGRQANRGDRPLTNELPVLAESLHNGGSMAKPVPTGISKLDAVIYGWQPTLCLVGADPGVGKSATLAKSAYHGAKNGIKSAFFSLEDPPRWIATRLVSAISRVEVLRILYGKLSESELALVEKGLEELGKVSDNIIVFDGSERPMATERLVATGRSLVSNSGVRCIYVDHAGELRSTERDRHDLEVAGQLSLLRGLANATGVPVVVAMHMRRRQNAKPTLADFANSSGAERKARLALALTREPGAPILTAHVLKQTNGPSGVSIDMPFDLQSGMVA